LAETNNKANTTIQHSVGTLMNSYSATAQKISESGIEALENLRNTGERFSSILAETGKKLADTYNHAGNSVSSEIENIKDSSKQYSAHLQKLNGNLNTLNSSFEAQIKGTEEQFKASQNFNKDLMAMNTILASSVEELKRYKENAEQLNKHLESLNTIYGNMLGAMSYKK
jgi:gliding motility-associated protein GldL